MSTRRTVLFLIALLTLCAPRATAAPAETADVVRVSVEQEPREAAPGGQVRLTVHVRIQSGWHVTAHQTESDSMIPTEVAFDPHPFLTVEDTRYPQPILHRAAFLNEVLSIYEESVAVAVDVRVSPKASAGQMMKLPGAVIVQACSDELCLRPSTIPFTVAVRVAGGGLGAQAPGASAPTSAMPFEWWNALLRRQQWWVWMLAALLGGLALNLTPCVYPMIPVTVAFFSGQAAGRWSQSLLLSVLYVLGMSVTYATLGVIASQTGALFGAWLQQPLVLIGMAGIMVILALSLFGLYELQPPPVIARTFGSARAGRLGAFVMGLVVGFIAAPCVGPFVLGLLVFVAKLGRPWLGFWLLFTMGLGMGLPFILIGLLSNRIGRLPKSGPWLVWPKRVLGVILCITALYFLRPLWRPAKPAASQSLVAWQAYHPALLEQAAREHRPVLIDIYADWCVPCIELDHVTFRDPGVAARLNGGFSTLRVDATGDLPADAQALIDRYGVYGVPTVLLFDAQGRERPEMRIAGFVTPQELRQALDRLAAPERP